MPHFPKGYYKKSRSTWYVQLDGKQHNLNSGCFAERPRLGPDEAEAAQERCVELKKLLREQTPPEPKGPVYKKAIVAIFDKFLEWVKDHRAPRTFEWYEWRLQEFSNHITRELTIDRLKHYHLDEWLKDHPEWASGTKHGMAQAVMAAIRWGKKKGYIEKNPIADYDKPPKGQRTEVIFPQEFDKILSVVSNSGFRDLLIVTWETGCRPQESLPVEARHVDLKNDRWVFPPEESKGKKWPRIVYLNNRALEITKRLMNQHPEGKLFRNSEGQPWTTSAVNCAFERVEKKLGKKFCLYDPVSVMAVDLDGDGDIDGLSASWRDDKIAWYENDGNQNFTQHVLSSSVERAFDVFAADIDADGDLDILAAGNPEVFLFENDGDENFTASVLFSTPSATEEVEAIDFDRDGDMDVVIAGTASQQLLWLENDGNNTFVERTITTEVNRPTDMNVAVSTATATSMLLPIQTTAIASTGLRTTGITTSREG